MYQSFVSIYLYVLSACLVAVEARREYQGDYEPPCGHWELNMGLLQEYQVFLSPGSHLSGSCVCDSWHLLGHRCGSE